MDFLDLIGLAVLFPLIGAAVNGLFGHKMPKQAVSYIACASVLLSFLTGVLTLFVFNNSSAVYDDRYISTLFTWIASGSLRVDFAFLVDPLSLTMVLIVSGVSFLIHVYSIGYMAHDKDYARFFTYLNLFVGAMLLLVLGSSLPVMFIGWEGVGLCSYLLIGFWYHKASANIAGMKAFVVNRIGDFGVLIAMFMLFASERFGMLDFVGINNAAAEYAKTSSNDPFIVAVALFLFLGATGKSAQIPLYVWLPDAMEGPTPVSALIHAATMVTSGVYMLARMNVLFFAAPSAMLVVALIGCLTAFLAATIAMGQFDIKRVLAYSTISQLGYMFLACGVGAFWVGIFHLMTHAFFKALLFLGSGSVIHGMGGEQDMRKMGGLAKRMPGTYWTFLVATLAIAGVPFFSGFFSKDEILAMTFWFGKENEAGRFLFIGALVTAMMTAFYMFRLLVRTFLGHPLTKEAGHAHESPRVMLVPLVILAVLAFIGGYVGLPKVMGAAAGVPNYFEQFLAPAAMTYAHVIEGAGHSAEAAAGETATAESAPEDTRTGWALVFLSTGIAGLGILLALTYFTYTAWDRHPFLKRMLDRSTILPYLVFRKWFVDELYQWVIVEPGKILAHVSWKFDQVVIDGIVNGTAGFFAYVGQSFRTAQTGLVRSYALGIMLGTAALLFIVILSRLVL